MSEKHGLYYVFEGMDGSGKTTQAQAALDYLGDLGREAILAIEPGGTPIGTELRTIIKDANLKRDALSNLWLFSIARHELVEQVIKPTLDDGKDAVSDRSWFSTYAYQGSGEGLNHQLIFDVSSKALGRFVLPDFAVIIDIPVEVAEERMKKRGWDSKDYFETKGRPFFEKVRQGYLSLAHDFDLLVVDGTQTSNRVHSDIVEHLNVILSTSKT